MSQATAPDAAARRQRSAASRRRGPLVLAVDLETLARSGREETARLAEELGGRPHTSMVYVAPGRSLHSAKVCVAVLHLPPADLVVADRGASVHAARRNAGIDALNAEIGAHWPGAHDVRSRISDLRHLLDEHRWEDARRVSYFPRGDVSVADAVDAVEEALADREVDVRVSSGEQIDVVPRGTDAVTTTMRAVAALGFDPSWVVVAGGWIEPRLLDNGGYWGIATGDTPESVRAALASSPRVHVTSVADAAGVLDGLRILEFL